MDIRYFLNLIKEETGIKTDKELAEAMGVKYGTLTKWVARNSLPNEPTVSFVVKRGIDLNKLFANANKQSLDNHTVGSAVPRMNKSVIDTVVENEAQAFAEQLRETYRFIAQYGNMMLLRKFEEELSSLSASYIEKCEKFKDMLKD